MDNKNSYIDLLIDSLNKKISILEDILELDQKQKSIALSEKFEMEALDAISDEKVHLIEEMNKLDDGFETMYDRVREELQTDKERYADQIRSMQGLIGKVVGLSTSIEAEEKRIQSAVDGQFGKLKQSVKDTRKNSKAVSDYYKNMSKLDLEPQFMDKKK
ncbi:MAG: hypothetical protein ACI4AQ_10640 [Lachnospiraceae bacterium]